MTEIADRYRTNAAAFADKVAAVSEDQWDATTPCPEWTARDLVQHVVDAQGMFLGFIGEEAPAAPSVEDDPEAAVRTATGAVQGALEDERATQEFEGFFGTSTFEAAVDRFLATDLTVHGWDLARATGQDERIRAEEIPRVRAVAESFGDAIRSPGAFGPEVDVPEGADDQARLLAFLGRHP
jgi:uncharacterized protein (TIGR03086 family)